MGYTPAPESRKPISLRLPVSLLSSVDDLVRIWKAQATARGDDATNIDRTHVIVNLMRTAVAGEYDLYGGRPTDKASWEKLETAIKDGVAKSSKK